MSLIRISEAFKDLIAYEIIYHILEALIVSSLLHIFSIIVIKGMIAIRYENMNVVL